MDGNVPSQSALTDAMTVLEGIAAIAEPRTPQLRTARDGDRIAVDLATPDGRCVLVGPDGWHVAPRSPILFRRSGAMKALPEPVSDGDGLARLQDLMNTSQEGFHLLVAWLVASFIPDLPHPILTFRGEQGTGKSKGAAMVIGIVDPSGAPRRVLAMTTIDAGALAGDLAERLLTIELHTIPDRRRREEAELDRAFRQAHPAILASLFDLLVKVLRVLPDVTLTHRPRMADFARVLAAVDHVTGWDTARQLPGHSSRRPGRRPGGASPSRAPSWSWSARDEVAGGPRQDPHHPRRSHGQRHARSGQHAPRHARGPRPAPRALQLGVQHEPLEGGDARRRPARPGLSGGPHPARQRPGRPAAAAQGAQRLLPAPGRAARRSLRRPPQAGHLPQRPRLRGRGPSADRQPAAAGAVDGADRGRAGRPRQRGQPRQARHLLASVADQGDRGKHLRAFFAVLYHAGLRPSEAVWLRKANCELPLTGWGTLHVDGSRPRVASSWTDSGAAHDERGLKWRPRKDVRRVPTPPALIQALREHLESYGAGPDGRLFRTARGGIVQESGYGEVWARARRQALTAEQQASPLAARPYDLRHACVSLWLNSGVHPVEVARRAGHSVAVLLKVYAKCLDGATDMADARIEAALGHWA
jgi:integrase